VNEILFATETDKNDDIAPTELRGALRRLTGLPARAGTFDIDFRASPIATLAPSAPSPTRRAGNQPLPSHNTSPRHNRPAMHAIATAQHVREFRRCPGTGRKR